MVKLRFFAVGILALMAAGLGALAHGADTLGTVGQRVVPWLSAAFDGDAAAATTVWTSLLTILGMVVSRVVLKRIPTVARGLLGKVIWSFLSGLFGDGVVLSNHPDPEYLKEKLKKKFPLLRIDVKDGAGPE